MVSPEFEVPIRDQGGRMREKNQQFSRGSIRTLVLAGTQPTWSNARSPAVKVEKGEGGISKPLGLQSHCHHTLTHLPPTGSGQCHLRPLAHLIS